MGPGLRVRVHSATVATAGELITGYLRFTSADGVNNLCQANAEPSASSGQCDLVWGTSASGAAPFGPTSLWGVYGLADGTTVDQYLTHVDASFGFVEDLSSAAQWAWDPTSGLWLFSSFSGGGGHDPMLDLIYAAVHRDFP